MLNRIADIFDTEKNYSEEAVWRERAWNLCRKNFLEDARETLQALRNLIWVYSELEDYDKIELYSRKLHAIKEKNLGASHIEVICEKERFADTLHDTGKYDEEIDLRTEIIKLYCENFSANVANKNKRWYRFISAMEGLAERFDEAGKGSEAVDIRKKIVAEQKEHLKELKKNSAPDDDIIRAMDDIADASHEVKDYNEELRYRLELVKFCQNNDVESDVTIRALESLADFYSEHAPKDAALKIYREILENYSLEPEDVDDIQEKIDALTQGDELEEEQSTEIDTSESLNLRKGQRVPLKKNNPALDKFTVDFHWEGDADLEIDASAFLLGTDGKTHADEDFIFYGNSEHQSGSVKYSSYDAQALMQIELKKIPEGVDKISFALTIYEADARKQNFSSVKVFTRVIDETARKEIFHFDLKEGFSVETAIVVGEIYRHKGEWKFNAVGAGFTGGLAALCKSFGVEVN